MSNDAKKRKKLQSRGEQGTELSKVAESGSEHSMKSLGPYPGRETGGSASSRDVSPNTPTGEEV